MEKYNVLIERTVFKGTQFVTRHWRVSIDNTPSRLVIGTIEETIFYDADGFETSYECTIEYPSGAKTTISSYQEAIGRLLLLTY